MKPASLVITASLGMLTLFSSCKKENDGPDTDPAIEATFGLSTDNSIADYMTEEDNDLLMEVTADRNLQGNGFAPGSGTENLLPCATVTVTPQTGFPKTILLTFDSTCTSPRGLVRKGIVRIVISDSIRKPGSTAVMTFENYFVSGFKREATSTWTNTSLLPVRSWERKVENGKITAPSGIFWLHQSIKTVTQTAGSSTLTLLDDVVSIAGNGSITNAAGTSRTATITEPLQKKFSCPNIDKGKIRFEGPNHFAILNYGDGDCDRFATISINGRPPRNILLR